VIPRTPLSALDHSPAPEPPEDGVSSQKSRSALCRRAAPGQAAGSPGSPGRRAAPGIPVPQPRRRRLSLRCCGLANVSLYPSRLLSLFPCGQRPTRGSGKQTLRRGSKGFHRRNESFRPLEKSLPCLYLGWRAATPARGRGRAAGKARRGKPAPLTAQSSLGQPSTQLTSPGRAAGATPSAYPGADAPKAADGTLELRSAGHFLSSQRGSRGRALSLIA
jgi:hypothetical protein